MLRVGLLGFGKWGKIWAEVIQNHPLTKLVAIGSKQETPAGIKCYPDRDELFQQKDMDAVVIASAPEFHLGALKIAANFRMPVILEKPMVLSEFEAMELNSFWPKDLPLLVNHVNLFHPGFRELAKRLKSEKICHIKSRGGNLGPYRESYTALWDYGAHDSSMILELLPNAETSKVQHEYTSSISKKENGLESNHRILLEFTSGLRAEIEVGNGFSQKERWLEVETEGGSKFRFDAVGSPVLSNWGKEIPVSTETPMNTFLDFFVIEFSKGNCFREEFARSLKGIQLLEKCAPADPRKVYEDFSRKKS